MHETERSDPFTEGRRSEALRLRAFRLFWSATTIRAVGTSIAGVAFQVLIVTVVAATPFQIGILSGLSVAPYLFLGLIVGALMDRWNRQRTLVLTSIGRALVLATVPVLLLLERLDFWSLAAVILTLGVLTLFAHSAEQPFLPHIVPRPLLVSANARLGQSETVAATAGPALGGTLVKRIGAPRLFAFEAAIHANSAILQLRLRSVEPPPSARRGPSLRARQEWKHLGLNRTRSSNGPRGAPRSREHSNTETSWSQHQRKHRWSLDKHDRVLAFGSFPLRSRTGCT
ncbi:MFS transporter [Microbacterium sp.]|uniref:MFS transporter n=1 Tax=Microbacterium sp. TaxID=51671 RepID=UPI0039E6F657